MSSSSSIADARNLARQVELLTQQSTRPLESYDAKQVLTDIEAQLHESTTATDSHDCSQEEDNALRKLRKALYTQLRESDWIKQDEIASNELKREIENENPDEKAATTALITETQTIVANLITNVTEGLQQSIETGSAATTATTATENPSYVGRCFSILGTAAKKTAVAAFSIVYFFLAKIYNFLQYIIRSSQFQLFLNSAWRIVRQHFCQFLAIKYGYDLKNYFARKMNPRTFYEGFLSKAIGQYFESSFFNNIFDTVATTVPELLQKMFGEIVSSTVNILYGALTVLKKLGSAFDIIGKVMTFLINLFVTALKTAMQLAFPAVIAQWAESKYFDLIVHSVFFAGCYGDIFAAGGAALGAYAAAAQTKTQKKSPKGPKFGGGKKPKDDDDSDSDSDDDGDVVNKIEEPQSRISSIPLPRFPGFSKTGTAFFPSADSSATTTTTGGFQFEQPETKSRIVPPPPPPAETPAETPPETMLDKIGKGLNIWGVFQAVTTLVQYKMEQSTRKSKI